MRPIPLITALVLLVQSSMAFQASSAAVPGLCASAAVAPPFLQQDDRAAPRKPAGETPLPGGEQHRGDSPRRRWEKLTEQEKQAIKERFKGFRHLSPGDQEAFRKRHAELLRLRQRVMAEIEEEISALPSEERRRIVDRRVREELQRLRHRIVKKEIVEEPPPSGPMRESARRMGRALNKRNDKLAERLLSQMLRDRAIDDETARRIGAQPREERISSVLRLHKGQILRTLEGSESPEEIERFRKMPPHRFHEEIRRERRERGLIGSYAGLCALTAEQEIALERYEDEVEQEKARIRFFDQNLRRRLIEMDIDPEVVEELFELPLHRRIERVGQLLQQVPPDKVPQGLRKGPNRRHNGKGGGLRKPRPERGDGVRPGGRSNGRRPPPPSGG